MWQKIENALEALRLPFRKVKIYQDGLPICGKELNITNDLAKLGSPNHRLLLKLVEQGARLMGTESAELLIREYELIRQGFDNKNQSVPGPQVEQPEGALKTNLQKRDKFIAERINHTLAHGEVGIVFLGMLHDLSPGLADDIEIACPLYSPQSRDGHDHVG